jgi:hypothetical protein
MIIMVAWRWDQLVVAHQRPGLMINRVLRRAHADPVGLARDRIIWPVGLFRMAMVDKQTGGHIPILTECREQRQRPPPQL